MSLWEPLLKMDWKNLKKWVWFAYFDFFAINIDGLHWKINANRIAVSFFILTRFESLYNTRFACTTISDQHNFKQIIECFIVRCGKQRIRTSRRHFYFVFGLLFSGMLCLAAYNLCLFFPFSNCLKTYSTHSIMRFQTSSKCSWKQNKNKFNYINKAIENWKLNI